jgi:hypothetical protein
MLLISAAEKNVLVNWVKSITLDDVVVDNSTMTLLSNKLLTICQISCAALQLFCVHHQVLGYKNKSKEVTCLCIIQAVMLKAIHKAMHFHHKDGSEVDEDDCTSDNAGDMVLVGKEEDGNYEDIVRVGEDEIINVLLSKKRKTKKSKSSAPDSLSKSGTYYRVMNAYKADINRPFVVNIGSNPNIAALDSCQYLHKAIYDILLLLYNDNTNNLINGFAFPEVMFFEQASVSIDVASEFDVLTSKDFSNVMGYLNFYYQVAHRKNNLQEVLVTLQIM